LLDEERGWEVALLPWVRYCSSKSGGVLVVERSNLRSSSFWLDREVLLELGLLLERGLLGGCDWVVVDSGAFSSGSSFSGAVVDELVRLD
jgi:hypothetical protein